MFFGVVIKPGKAYSQTLEHDLLLAQVAVGEAGKKGDRSVLVVEVEGHRFVVATLRFGEVDQSQINIHLIAGTAVKFLNPTGNTELHVVGNYIIDEDDEDFYDYDDEFNSEDSELSEDSEGDDDDADDDQSSSDDEDVFARDKNAKRPADRISDASQDHK